jgi:putative restriction endonuclease
MRYWVGLTDRKWFDFLDAIPALEEINFWQPTTSRPVRLELGAPWLFKLHASEGGFIVGGGYFAHWTTITPRFAWQLFGARNGAPDLGALVRQVASYRRSPVDPDTDQIGATVLVQPFFLPQDLWFRTPTEWQPGIMRGKAYDTSEPEGATLWERTRIAMTRSAVAPATVVREGSETRYGDPTLVRPRLGQGTFRLVVTDAYDRRCVVTGERTLPVLEAAHIRPYSEHGPHEPNNGLLLRSDLHTLFDRGYMTVDPDLRLRVSGRIRQEFENGRDYYALDGTVIRAPLKGYPPPSREHLEWHRDSVFRG